MKYIKDSIIAALLITSFVFVISQCRDEEVEYRYKGAFTLATQVDLGDPLFYKIDKYYVYANITDLGENPAFDPIALAPYFIGVFEHDSLIQENRHLATIEFKSKMQILEGVVFASGTNRFNNTRFSAGDKFIVRRIE